MQINIPDAVLQIAALFFTEPQKASDLRTTELSNVLIIVII